MSEANQEKWSLRHWMAQQGGHTCKQCGAFVDANCLTLHEQWHDRILTTDGALGPQGKDGKPE
jgi:hypothetical protein